MLRLPTHARLIYLVVLVVCAMALPASAVDLKLSSSSLSFVTVVGTSPAPQQVSAYTDPAGGSFSPAVTASTQSGGQWLAVSTSTGGSFTGSVTLTVSVKSASLAIGDYAGSVTVAQSGLNGSPATIGVSLKVIPASPYLSVTPSPLTFGALPGSDASPAGISIQNTGGGTMVLPSLTATTATGGNWLAVTQPTAGSFANFTSAVVQVHSASLAAGTYTGTITVTSTGAVNSPLNVPVTLTIGQSSGPVISVAPNSISFLAGLGANPYMKPLTINNTGAGQLKPTITSTGGKWLVVGNPIGGSFDSPASLSVLVDITGLSVGTYQGGITVSDPNSSNGSVNVPVTLTLTDPQPVMSISEPWVAFSTASGATTAMQVLEYITNVGIGAMPWTATVQSGTPWLSVDKSSGTAAFTSTFSIKADPTGLANGIYNSQVTIDAPTAVAGLKSQVIKVTLAVGTPLPNPSDNGIVNAASFVSHTIAPGSIVAIFGNLMGPSAGLSSGFVGGKLPSDVGGAQVLFNYTDSTGSHSVPAPLYYAADGQINAQVPFELAGQGTATMQVAYNGVPSRSVPVNLKGADPGIFLAGTAPIVTFNGTATIVTKDNPAKPGDNLVIYATGLGVPYNANEKLGTGVPAPPDASRLFTVSNVKVLLGGVAIDPQFAGLTPTQVGLYQINFQVPSNAVSGANSLILAVGTEQTAPATLYIR